jgi:hypothetical protein
VSEVIQVAEIGGTGVAAAIAASHLGLTQIHLLMIVFFSVTLAGQFLSALLARKVRVSIGKREHVE